MQARYGEHSGVVKLNSNFLSCLRLDRIRSARGDSAFTGCRFLEVECGNRKQAAAKLFLSFSRYFWTCLALEKFTGDVTAWPKLPQDALDEDKRLVALSEATL